METSRSFLSNIWAVVSFLFTMIFMSLKNLIFYDLFNTTSREVKLKSAFNLLTLVTLSLLPLWVGFSWDYISNNFNVEAAVKFVKDAIRKGELLIICLGFSAPVFIYVTKKTPEHRTVNKQLLLYLTYFLSIFTLVVYLGVKTITTDISVGAECISIILFLTFLFITYVANLANENIDGYTPQSASNDLKEEADDFGKDLKSFGGEDET